MALDLTNEVGPGGEYITHEHTLNHMRYLSQSTLFDRRDRENWLKHSGGKALAERAYEEAMHIVENHEPISLPAGAAETMKAIIDDYEAALQTKSK